MPINDTDEGAANCALCSVAGLLGSTASKELSAIERHLTGKAVSPSEAFNTLAEAKGLAPPAKGINAMSTVAESKAQVEAQILGIEYWLRARTGKATHRHGDAQNPLQEAVLRAALVNDPVAANARYLCLIIGDKIEGTNAFAMHWVVAGKSGGSLSFTDHQLDTETFKSQYDLVGRRRVNEAGLWGPQTGSPTLSFAGKTPCKGTYRYMAIGLAGWQDADPTSDRGGPAIGGHRAKKAA